jgi:peptide/nickel transport system substrate-binding protein
MFPSTHIFAEENTTLKIALPIDPETLIPFEWRSQNDLPVFSVVYNSLVRGVNVKKNMRFKDLAESITILPNKKDIKITLRKGPKFHNGDPLTAHDVKFTVEQVQNPENANALIGFFDEIESVEVVDDYTLIYRFYDPYASWQETMWVSIVPKKYYEKVGKNEFKKKPVGSGPYRFVDRKIGESITLEAVENHIDHKPDFKIVKLMIVPDRATRTAMLETGEIDFIYNVQPHEVERLKMRDHIKVKKVKMPSMFYLSIKPCIYPVLNDIKVRQALNCGINRQEIIDKIYLGEGYPLYMWANPNELGYDPTYKVEYNPEKAKKLLSESRYNGETFIIAYSSVMPSASHVAELVQHYLNEMGIKTKLWQLEYGTYLTYCRNKDKRAGHMALSQFTQDYDPGIRMMMSMMRGSQYGYYKDGPNQKEMDRLILEQARATNPVQRLKILKKIHKINNADPAQIALLGLYQIYAMNKRIDYNWPSYTFYVRDFWEIKRVNRK